LRRSTREKETTTKESGEARSKAARGGIQDALLAL